MTWAENFVLMNKDKEVISFKSQSNEFGIVSFKANMEPKEPLPPGFDAIEEWLEKRQAPKHREHIAKLLRTCGCYNLDGFIRISHALSLNDTFWVKPEQSRLEWCEVSLYANPFNEMIARIAFEGGLYGEQFSTTSPEFGTDGTYAKCWVRQEDEIYLLKKGSSGARNAGLEPYSEFYGAQLSNIICKTAVPYDLVMQHKALASKCPLFTDEDTGFAPIWKILGNTKDPGAFLEYFKKLDGGDLFRRMLVFDALTLNTDRHSGNFGVLVDNQNQAILRMAPVFDNNQALLPYAIEEDFKHVDHYLESRPTCIGVDFNDVAHKMLTPEIRSDLKNLKGFTFERHEQYNLPDGRLKALEAVIDKQVKNILHDIRLYVPDKFLEPGNVQNEVQPKFEMKAKEKQMDTAIKEKEKV